MNLRHYAFMALSLSIHFSTSEKVVFLFTQFFRYGLGEEHQIKEYYKKIFDGNTEVWNFKT